MTTGIEPQSGSDLSHVSFDVLPIVMSHYVDTENWPELAEAETEAAAIGEIFQRFGGVLRPWDTPGHERNMTATTGRLTYWATIADSSVLLWIGHGSPSDDNHDSSPHLVVLGLQGSATDEEMIPAAVATHIIKAYRRRTNESVWTMIVIEACGAADFVRELHSLLLAKRVVDGVLIIGCGADRGRGYLGTFRRALNNVAESIVRYSGNDTRITLGEFARRMAEQLPTGLVQTGRLAGTAPLVLPPRILEPITASIDVYGELRAVIGKLEPHERDYFAVKGMGADLGEFGWNFAGRGGERAAVSAWLNANDSGVYAITGPAGCGKSALLGNILLHARPEVVEFLTRTELADDSHSAESVPPPAVDGSLLLTGASLHDAVDRLADIAGVPVPFRSWPAYRRADALSEQSARRDGPPLTIFADALDQARDPLPIAALLRDLGALPGVRIVAGTRPSTAPGGTNDHDDHDDHHDHDLLDELGCHPKHGNVLRLHRDPAAIAGYVRRMLRTDRKLRAALGEVFEDLVEEAVRMIAEGGAGTGTAGKDFLEARLIVHELSADHTLLRSDHRPRLVELIGRDRDGLFRYALERMRRTHPLSTPALETLAFAQGRGIPRADRLWATLAEALGDVPAGSLTDEVLDDLLRLAGPYIMLDSADGQSVYRLAHHTFQEHFLQGQETPARQRLVCESLIEVSVSVTAPVLTSYLRRHLTGHVAAVGVESWTAFEEHPDLLDQIDIHTLVADVIRTGGGLRRMPSQVVGAYMTSHLAAEGDHRDRRGLRQLGAAQATGSWSAPRADDERVQRDDVGGAAWELRWARLRKHPPHLTLGSHGNGDAVRCLTVVDGPDGMLLASGGDDGFVRFWDPVAVREVRSDIPRHAGSVMSLASYTTAGGRTRVVSAGSRDPTRVWQHSGQAVSALSDVMGQSCVAYRGSADHTQLAIGGFDGPLRIWDPLTGVERPLTGHTGPITAVVALTEGLSKGLIEEAEKRLLLVSAGRDRVVRVWDPEPGRRLRVRDWTAHETPIRSLAVVRRTGLGDLIATGGDDGTVVCWDPATGTEAGSPMRAHDGAVLALCAVPGPMGSDLLASGGDDGKVRLWDPVTGKAVGPALTGHGAGIHCLVAFAGAGGESRIASGSNDGTIRVWEVETALDGGDPDGEIGQAVDRPSEPGAVGRPRQHISLAANSVVLSDDRCWHLVGALGETLVAVAGRDGSISCHDVATGGTTTLPAEQAAGPAREVVAFTGAAGETVLAVAGHDGVIRTWTSQGRPYGKPLIGHREWVNAMVAVTTPARLLVSGGDDRTLLIWDPLAATLVRRVPLGTRILTLARSGEDIMVETEEGSFILSLLPDSLTAGP